MKKILIILAALFTIILSYSVYAEENIKLNVKGEVIQLENQPVIIDSRVFVPMRPLLEALDKNIAWDNNTKTITISGINSEILEDRIEIKMQINSKIKTVDGKSVTMDVAPVIIDNVTYIPARYAVEDFHGIKAFWSGTNRTIYICSAFDEYPSFYNMIPGGGNQTPAYLKTYDMDGFDMPVVDGYDPKYLTDGTVDEYINLLKDNGFDYSTEKIGSETVHILSNDNVSDLPNLITSITIYIGKDINEHLMFVGEAEYTTDTLVLINDNTITDTRPYVEEYITEQRVAAGDIDANSITTTEVPTENTTEEEINSSLDDIDDISIDAGLNNISLTQELPLKCTGEFMTFNHGVNTYKEEVEISDCYIDCNEIAGEEHAYINLELISEDLGMLKYYFDDKDTVSVFIDYTIKGSNGQEADSGTVSFIGDFSMIYGNTASAFVSGLDPDEEYTITFDTDISIF